MIFLTAGTQLPFDRLTRAMDDWAARNQDIPVFGQIGRLERDSYTPEHFEWAEMIGPDMFAERVAQAGVIVSHAGMGSIITAATHRKPIVIMARQAALGEHRNDHQCATVERFRTRPGIFVANDKDALPGLLDRLLQEGGGSKDHTPPPEADERLIAALRDFIHRN